MQPSSPLANILLCTQCGGELHPDEGQLFLTCPYCSSTVYLDKSQVVFHWYLAPTMDETKAQQALKRWMAGNQTVKDLDEKARLYGGNFEYFPLWYFKYRFDDGREEIMLQPAAATAVSELTHLRLPAGDLRRYEPSLDSQAHAPTVPLSTALQWLKERKPGGQVLEQALVHVPIYTFKYTYKNQPYTALIEAGTGEVFANIFPAKAEAPYQMAGCISASVFFSLALVPLFGILIDSAGGAFIGLLICSGLGLLAAPALFMLAAWVAAKV
jgi:hypothetical protein